MKNKFGLLLLLLMYLTILVIVMLGMLISLANGRIFFAIITMYGVSYYVTKACKTFKRLTD